MDPKEQPEIFRILTYAERKCISLSIPLFQIVYNKAIRKKPRSNHIVYPHNLDEVVNCLPRLPN